MEKNPGGQKFWQRGEGRFREILSCPPKMRVAPQIPPPPKFRDLAPPLKTIYLEIIDSPSAAIYKIYGAYPEAI